MSWKCPHWFLNKCLLAQLMAMKHFSSFSCTHRCSYFCLLTSLPPALIRSFVEELWLKFNLCVLQDSLTSAEDKDNKFSRQGSLLFEVLGVLHNLSKRINNKKHFDNSSAVETLLSFFRTKLPVYRMTALLALAYLVDEKNNHLIMASEGKRSWKIINKSIALLEDFLVWVPFFFSSTRGQTSALVSLPTLFHLVLSQVPYCYLDWQISNYLY